MRRLRRLSLSIAQKRTPSTSDDSGESPGGNNTSGPALRKPDPIYNMHSPVIEIEDQQSTDTGTKLALSSTNSMDSSMSCGDTTTGGTNTTSSHTEDDSLDQADVPDKEQHEDLSLIDSIHQLDAMLSGRSITSKPLPSIDFPQHSIPQDKGSGNMRARRASTGGAVCECETTGRPMDSTMQSTVHMSGGGTKLFRRLSGGHFHRANDPPLESSASNNCPISGQATNWSRFSPAKKAVVSIRHKSIRFMRRYSVNHRPSSEDQLHDVPLQITSSSEDPPSVQETALLPARVQASEVANDDGSEDCVVPRESANDAPIPIKSSGEHVLASEDRGSSNESESDDAASDVVHYNTDDEVYNARRNAFSPKRAAKLPIPSQRVSLMNLMPRSSSPIRPRSICSLPTPRNEFESDDSEYDDDTISSVSDVSGAGDVLIDFDGIEAPGNQNASSSCVTPGSSRRRRSHGRAPIRLNSSFHSDLSSEVEESLKDSVVGRRQTTVHLAKRVATRRTSLGTATSASSEPDDSIADSLANRHKAITQPRRRQQTVQTGAEAIGWEPTFVSPIKENHRRRLSLSNIPNALNDGSRGLPRFNSMRMMLSDESEDTFMVENDDASEA